MKKILFGITLILSFMVITGCSGSDDPTTEIPTTEEPTTLQPTGPIGYNTIKEEVEHYLVDNHRRNSLFLKDEQLVIRGENRVGQLGNGTYEDEALGVDILAEFDLDEDDYLISIQLGEYHGLALSEQGRVFTWGHNAYGKLGIAPGANQPTPIDITDSFDLIVYEKIVYIKAGRDHNGVITSYGRVFTWGVNAYGQLGNGEINLPWEETVYLPQDITDYFGFVPNDFVVKLAFGNNHSMALTFLGRVFVWGDNEVNQLGTDDEMLLVPTEITDLFNLNDDVIIDISAGYSHSGFLTSYGRVFVFGDNNDGQLGIGIEPRQSDGPIEITDLLVEAGIITNLRFTHNSSAVIGEDEIYVFGFNFYGQLGLGNKNIVNTPTILANENFTAKVIDIIIAREVYTVIYEDGEMMTMVLTTFGE